MNIKKVYEAAANDLGLGNLSKMKTGPERTALVQQLADRLHFATDSFERDRCLGGLVMLFYGEAPKMQDMCSGLKHMEYEDFVQHLAMCVDLACTKADWLKGGYNAEQSIRTTIATRGGRALLQEANFDKNRANGNTMNLDDTPASTDDDTPFVETIEDNDYEKRLGEEDVASIVQLYLNNHKPVEAIFIDLMAHLELLKRTKETVEEYDEETGEIVEHADVYIEFKPSKLVKILNELPEEYIEYFAKNYMVNSQELSAAVDRIKTCNNQKLYKMIDLTRADVKKVIYC